MDNEEAMRDLQTQKLASLEKLRMLKLKEKRVKQKNQGRLAEAGHALVIVYLLTKENMKESLTFLSHWFAEVSDHPRFSEQWLRQQVLELDEATRKEIQSGSKPARVKCSTYRKIRKYMADLGLWKGVRDVNNRAGVTVSLKKVQHILTESDTTRPIWMPKKSTSETPAAFKKRMQRWAQHWNVGRGTIPVGEKIPLEAKRKKATGALQSSQK